jgi:hypothetical protein
MTNDRTYWRDAPDARILEAARYCDNDLALVLGERLEAAIDAEAQLDDAKREIVELNARLDRWMEQANALQAQLEAK